MVDDHTIPFKEQRPRENDTSAVCCCDRGSSGHAEIEALMRALHGTIEDALDSEHVGDRGIHRRRERTSPFAVRADSFKNLGFRFFVLFDLSLVFGAGRGIASGNLQQQAGIALAFHSNFLFECGWLSFGSAGGLASPSFRMQLNPIYSLLSLLTTPREL